MLTCIGGAYMVSYTLIRYRHKVTIKYFLLMLLFMYKG